jgi:hypothetical protein
MKSEKILKARRRAWVNWMLLTLFFIGIPSFAHADISDILLKFNPYIAAQSAYSNNILLTKTNKLNDFITTVNPGLGFSDLEPGKYGIDLDAVAGYTYYAKNHDFSYFSPAGNLNAWYAMTSNLTFRVNDYLSRSDAAREQLFAAGASTDQFLLSTQRGVHAIYLRNVVEPSVEYRFGAENFLSVLYRNNIYRNQNPLFENSQENTINPKFNYWFDIRNGVTLEYLVTFGHFQTSPNFVENGPRVRYTYRFDPRLSLFGEYLFLRVDFENPGGNFAGGNFVDYDVHNPNLGIEYKFSPTLTGLVQGGYYWDIPAQGSTSRGPSGILSLEQRLERTTYTVLLQGGYTQDYFTAQNLGFSKYYAAFGTINHQLTQRMSVFATGSVERSTLTDGQKDWIWIARGGASYSLLRWLSISLEGSFTEDYSNISEKGYKEYRVIAGITLGRPTSPTSRQTIMGQPTFLRTIVR